MTSIVPIKNGINFRDLGGIKTMDGRAIRSGMLYRSGDFSHITPDESNYLANNLNIIYVLDYRDKHEVDKKPDNLWHNATYINKPANPLSKDVTASLTSDLNVDLQQFKKNRPIDFMIKLYQLLPFNNVAYQQLVSLLLNANGQPLVQHCAVGKDRTGVGVALTLFALGVSEETIMDDYLLTDKLLASYLTTVFEQYKHKLTADELEGYQQIFLAKKEYLTAALDAIKHRYKAIDNWLAKEYQLTEQNKKIIQATYLV